jgi:single-stranded DNA-binding protein
MNTVHLIGELVTPLELKRDRRFKRSWGRTVIAVPRGNSGVVDFVPVTLRDREADMAARYLGDGSLVSIDGHIHSALQPYPTADDLRAVRRSLWVIANRVTYLRLPPRTAAEVRP